MDHWIMYMAVVVFGWAVTLRRFIVMDVYFVQRATTFRPAIWIRCVVGQCSLIQANKRDYECI